MNEIPEDIMQAAKGVWNALPVSHIEALRDPVVLSVGHAIQAERERCAGIADMTYRTNEGYRQSELGRQISIAIRNPT